MKFDRKLAISAFHFLDRGRTGNVKDFVVIALFCHDKRKKNESGKEETD
jgi:hypothetical protein